MEKIYVISDFDMQIDEITVLEMLSKASQLAAANGSEVALVGVQKYPSHEALRNVEDYGADIVHVVCSEQPVSSAAYHALLSDIIKKDMPKCVVFADSEAGKEVSARLAVDLDCGLTADCVDIFLDDSGEYVFARTALNDSVVARIKGEKQATKMTTVKKGAFSLLRRERVSNRKQMEIRCLDCSQYIEKSRRNGTGLIETLREILEEQKEAVDITQSKVLFCAGRGIMNKEALDMLFEVSEKIGVQVACSRCLVDEGVMPRERQVGQSGKSVSPSVYVAFGVSGACQHIVGIKNAGYVIAVNTDPHAPIFSFADFSIISDAKAVIREMYDKLCTSSDTIAKPPLLQSVITS